jgi:hypothetical protein
MASPKTGFDSAELLELIFALHKHDGTPGIGRLPGLWHRKIDERWTLWANGQLKPVELRDGFMIQPGDCYIEFNGWPAGSLSLITGEGILAAGTAANMLEFCAALRSAVAEVK